MIYTKSLIPALLLVTAAEVVFLNVIVGRALNHGREALDAAESITGARA